MASRFKKYQSKIRSFNWYWYVINGRKSISGGICRSIYWYAKANKKYIKDYDKHNKSSYIQYWDVNNLYGWTMSQQFSVNNFQRIKDRSQFNENFIKNYNEGSDEGYFLEVDVQYLEKLHELHN